MRLSLPSFDQVGAALLRIYKRFPFVIFVSVIGTVSAIWLAELSYAEQDSHPKILALAFCSGLGISFLFGLATFLEQKNWGPVAKYGLQLTGLLLIALYWILLGDMMMEGPSEVWYRFFLFALASHLFAAFAPFISWENLDQFWEYNKTLFLRVLLSVLYSGVLFVGLSVALLALDNLLDLDVDGETYFQLFLFLGGIFNTWFFLTGVPEKDNIQEKETTFPTGLRVFVQYVLIPLVTVYIVILYLYLGKIILQWELPNGWVSNLVLTFSIAGILSLLLLYPIRNSKEYNWIRVYSKGYYLALIPLIGLLMFSIWVRISEYGVTINRYFVATLGVWLTGIVIYFIISKTKSIKVIPVSLCLISLGISFGPLGAFAVSERSQLGRFEEILSRNDMLGEDLKVQEVISDISFAERKEISSMFSYLTENHSTNRLQSYLPFDLDTLLSDSESIHQVVDYRSDAEKIMNELDLEYISEWQKEELKDDQFSYRLSENEVIELYDYDILLMSVYQGLSSEMYRSVGYYNIEYDMSTNRLAISSENSGHSLEVNIMPKVIELIESRESGNNVSHEKMTIYEEDDFWNLKILIASVSGVNSDSLSIQHLRTHILIKEKQ